jgi:Tol biopolymer transport system component
MQAADRIRSVALAVVLALPAMAALLLLAGPSSVRAAFPGKPGLIVFDTSRQSGGAQSEEDCASGGDAIETMKSDGSHRRRLGFGVDPAYSPDGRLIAYTVCDGVQTDLMLMRSDGSHARAVTETAGVSEGEPAFSADGTRLFFARDSGGEGYTDIYSIRLDGGGLRRLAGHGREDSDTSPQAAANGRYVVFSTDGELFTMRPNGSRRKRLALGWDPTISPDSRRIVYTRKGQLHIIGAGGGGGRQLTHLRFTNDSRGAALSAAFSPNGRWVAFALERSVSYGPGFADSQKLMKVEVASGRTRTLTKTSVGGFHPDWQPLR